MISQYVSNMGQYRIVLNRQEAETLANSGTKWDLLRKALNLHQERDEFILYGNRYEVLEVLSK